MLAAAAAGSVYIFKIEGSMSLASKYRPVPSPVAGSAGLVMRV
jgi:hypothetical protein